MALLTSLCGRTQHRGARSPQAGASDLSAASAAAGLGKRETGCQLSPELELLSKEQFPGQGTQQYYLRSRGPPLHVGGCDLTWGVA